MLDELVSAGATPKKIAIHFSSIAFSDIANYVHIDEGGAIHAIPLKQISKQKRFAIKKVKNHATIKETKEGDQVWKDSRIEYEALRQARSPEVHQQGHGIGTGREAEPLGYRNRRPPWSSQ